MVNGGLGKARAAPRSRQFEANRRQSRNAFDISGLDGQPDAKKLIQLRLNIG
jgi:hypothetical protein